MGRLSARTALAQYLEPPAIQGLNTIYSSFVKVIPGEAFTAGQPPGTASGAVGVVFIVKEEETRIAIGGQKQLDYLIELHVFHRSAEPDARDAMAHFDGVIDAIKTRLRGPIALADHTMGGAFWTAGEARMTAEYGEPMLNGEVTETWGQVTFVATEMLAPQA